MASLMMWFVGRVLTAIEPDRSYRLACARKVISIRDLVREQPTAIHLFHHTSGNRIANSVAQTWPEILC
jgi:hypothetical protein